MSYAMQLTDQSRTTAILFLHGFTATPSELEPTAQLLRQRGFEVYTPLLPGHGNSPQELNRSNWKDWFDKVNETLDQINDQHERIIVTGLSMGGLLALLAAVRLAEKVDGVVAINAPIWALSFPMNCLWQFSFLLPPLPCSVKKAKLEALPGREAYDVYPVRALRSMLSLRKLVMRECSRISLPASIIQSRMDEQVSPRSGAWLVEKIINADYTELYLAGHVATIGVEREKIVEAICQLDQRLNEK